jgi:hypothetical protein
LMILGLLGLCVMLHLAWPNQAAVSPRKPVEPEPIKPKRQHAIAPKPFAGLQVVYHQPAGRTHKRERATDGNKGMAISV